MAISAGSDSRFRRVMMKRHRPLLPVLFMLVMPVLHEGALGQTTSDDATATEGALFLLLPVGAQGVSVGRAMTARGSAESAFWNPAGLAGVSESRLLVMRGDYLVGEATALSGLVVRDPVGVIALSYQLLDGGDQDLTDRDGNVRGAISVRSHVGMISFATSLTSWLDVGFSGKLIRFNLNCRGQCNDAGVQSTGWAIDLGAQIQPFPGLPLRLGAMLAHLGPDFQVVNAEQADPLPTRVRVSAAYDLFQYFGNADAFDLWAQVEVEDRWTGPGRSPSFYAGTEFIAGTGSLISVRSGYVRGEVGQADGFAVGFGLRFERFDLGLAKSLAGSIAGEREPVHVSFGIVF